ncbi:hypothetical protein Acr_06g0006710 [Actinidia rufa]|uniref:Uncharacterized protein n=1 Tax=Actinidia rufa TaxID=165716 RepID=A0A7J0EQG8_9ERIC|nr:hypothetical protein Acr_06g0006710 [Actinidia rufa]
MHLRTEVPASSHRGAWHPPLVCTAPPTGVRRKVSHFASCRGSISPPLCAQLERTPPLIKSRAKRLASASPRPSLYNFSKSTWSPSSKFLYGHPALILQVPLRIPQVPLRLLCVPLYNGCFPCPFSLLIPLDPCQTVAPPIWTLFSNRYSPPVFFPHSISLFPLETLRIPSLASKLHPFESSIPIEIKFFHRLGTCLTSVNVTDLPSAMRNQTDPLPTTLLDMLFAIHIRPSHAAYVENTSLSLHKW